MKRIVLILSILVLLSLPAFGDNIPIEVEHIDNIGDAVVETQIVKDDSGYMMLVIKTTTYTLDTFNIEVKTVEATVVINAKSTSYSKIKSVVEKEGTQYIYNLVDDIEYLPLQMGSGSYEVSLLGSNDGRRFRNLTSKTFNVTLEENAVFLARSQTVNWDSESDVAILAQALTLDMEEDLEKLEAIHTHIIENVRYDYQKAAALPKGYIPNADMTLEEGKGICYDFAAVLASMMRSVDVPAKLIKGYSSYTPVYHAWNEILVDDEWLIVDASTDSIFLDYNVTYKLAKSRSDYKTSKEY